MIDILKPMRVCAVNCQERSCNWIQMWHGRNMRAYKLQVWAHGFLWRLTCRRRYVVNMVWRTIQQNYMARELVLGPNKWPFDEFNDNTIFPGVQFDLCCQVMWNYGAENEYFYDYNKKCEQPPKNGNYTIGADKCSIAYCLP